MSAVVVIEVACDHLGCTTQWIVRNPLPNPTIAFVRRKAREAGWYCGRPSAPDRRDLCPLHAAPDPVEYVLGLMRRARTGPPVCDDVAAQAMRALTPDQHEEVERRLSRT